MDTLRNKLIDSRFTYLNDFEQMNNLTSLIESEQQDEMLFVIIFQYLKSPLEILLNICVCVGRKTVLSFILKVASRSLFQERR